MKQKKSLQRQLHEIGFNNLKELKKALKEYREKNFPEDCIPEEELDLTSLDDIVINFDFDMDFDFSFLDKKEK